MFAELQLTSQDKQSGFYVIIVMSSSESEYNQLIVKLRRGSGKDQQGMAPKAKGLKA